jgi:transcriptional regulator with XRE-family HTH domain
MNTWAKRIRDLRELGMTLAEIGTEIGIATSSVSDIATGRTKEPGGDAALKLHGLHLERCARPIRPTA